MSRRRIRVSLLLVLAVAGCYRTHYVNLQPPERTTASATPTRSGASGWQHFFLFGWLPRERVYSADQVCGPNAEVQEIRTQRSFLQGLVAILASYYVNIYSPYGAEIFCIPVPPPAPTPNTPNALDGAAPRADG